MLVRVALGTLLLAAVIGVAAAQDARLETDDDAESPSQSELVEQARVRLLQLDVTVHGPPERAASLTAEDFEIKLGFRRIPEFDLDRFCSETRPAPPALGEPPALDPRARRASYIFYLDQPHLTAAGRTRTFQLIRELVPKLILDGHQGMLVSNASRLDTRSLFTTDADELLDALTRLEDDPEHWDFFAIQERSRIEDVVETLNREQNVDLAIAKARWHQREERWRTEKNLRRLESVLARMADIELPKAILYFADTMRSNAGEHYLSFFGNRLLTENPVLIKVAADAQTANLAYDRVINEASAQGIRFYSVLAEGLSSHLDLHSPDSSASTITGTGAYSPRRRIDDARNTLSSLSSETGGHAFVHGARAQRIADRINSDFSCLYLISFDASRYSEDKPHRVVVKVLDDAIEARSRGRVVMQSESARLTSRLLGAFTSPDEATDELVVHSALVPTGFKDGSYSALVQVSVPGVPLAGATWDLGASLVSKDRVRAEASGRLTVSGPGVPVVLESEVRFPPGEFEMVAVAHEATTDMVVSGQAAGDWPDPGKGVASVGPIALLQPEVGAFLRDGEIRTTGPMATREGLPVRGDRPIAFIGLVCRGRSKTQALRVERTLTGDSPIEFPAIDLETGEERCAQVRDLVPANTMGPGAYSYEIRIEREGDVVDRGERDFVVAEPDS